MPIRPRVLFAAAFSLIVPFAAQPFSRADEPAPTGDGASSTSRSAASPAEQPPPAELARFFQPPEEFRDDFGEFRSPLVFADGTRVRNADD
ncbi:MAG: hypothetical protein WD066_13285 [Planctomycetaceae bacterium]